MTKFQIKRIIKKVKAPDIDIPEITPVPRRRMNIRYVYATAALALVIIGASVIGIKGNIFGDNQPLPPIDIDTPDTPDTPTPPEDDVKIVYADSDSSEGLALTRLSKVMVTTDPNFLGVKDSEEYADCKFALYFVVGVKNGYLSSLAPEFDERYRYLYDIESACSKLSNEVKYYFQNFQMLTEDEKENALDSIFDKLAASGLTAEQYKRKFGENAYVSFEVSSQQIIAGIEQYTEKFGDDFFQNDELEMVKEFLSLTREDFYNEETVGIYEAFRRIYSYNWHWRKFEYTEALTSRVVDYFKGFGVDVKPVDIQDTEKRKKIIQLTNDPVGYFETALTKDELYALAEAMEKDYTETGEGYLCDVRWRAK